VGSPNITKIGQEISQLKKLFIKPFNSKMSPEIADELT
jgi:hypothetical protein